MLTTVKCRGLFPIAFVFFCGLSCSPPRMCQGKAQPNDDIRPTQHLIRESFKAEAEGRLTNALSVASKLPQDAFSVFRQGKLLFKMGQLDEAYAAISSVAAAAPWFPSALSYLAYLECRAGNLERCAATCAQALNVSILDSKAVVILQTLPDLLRQRYQRLIMEHEDASTEKHRNGGQQHSQTKRARPADSNQTTHNLTLISSANSLYFDCLGNMVGSAQLREPNMHIVVYDLGLDELERLTVSSWKHVSVARLPVEEYPSHVRNLRNYAWKPLVYQHALQTYDKILYQVGCRTLFAESCLCVWYCI